MGETPLIRAGAHCIYEVDTEGIMRAVIRRWGNSAAVRIPAAVLETAALRCDQAVEVRAEAGQIVIEPVRREAFRLADLVAGITDENLHGEVDFGAPVGRERL